MIGPDSLLYTAASFLVSFATAWWIFKYVLRIAVDKNIVDNPNARKLQKEPVPVLGGVAVAFGILAATVIGGIFCDMSKVYPLTGIMMIMLYIGVMDDILGLSPRLRFVVEILVVLALIYTTGFAVNDFHGLWGIGRLPQGFAVCLTVFAGVGIINAINMIDGVNGLCSGYCIFVCAVFGVFFASFGGTAGAFFAAACIGALIPFLCHNIFGLKSKMFIGDGGTLLMGTVMTYFVLDCLHGDVAAETARNENLGLVPFALSVLAVPVFDTLRVMTVRMLRGRSPFAPDKSHLHHLLFEFHFSHIGTTCTEILLNMLVVGVWWTAYALGASIDMQLYAVLLTGFGVTFGLYGLLTRIRRRDTCFYHALLRFGDRTHVGHSKWFLKCRERLDRE